MLRSRKVGFAAAFVYISLILLPVVTHGQSKTSPLKITVYKTPT
ncbi:MAG: hypothetical protein ACM3SP_07015 [Chloroflexota bacterium]